jgi:hypothetical protein
MSVCTHLLGIVPVKNLYDPALATELLYLSTSAYSATPQSCLARLPALSQSSWVEFGEFSSKNCDIVNSTCFGFVYSAILSLISNSNC